MQFDIFRFLLLIVAAGISIYALGWLLLLAIVPVSFILLLLNQRGN